MLLVEQLAFLLMKEFASFTDQFSSLIDQPKLLVEQPPSLRSAGPARSGRR
jgi:hypothetical protein